MNNSHLSPKEVTKIQTLANYQRHDDKLNGNSVGSKIFTILQNKGINVLLFSLNENSENSILGLYIRKPNSVSNKPSHYIAINSTVPYDDVIFNFCHEYYHFLTDDINQVLITRAKIEDDLTEVKANRFAAEYLLPALEFELFIKSENDGNINLNGYPEHLIFRIIAMSVIKFQIAYQVVVKRLFEVNSISMKYRDQLLKHDSRDTNSVYYTIGRNLGGNDFDYLNKPYMEFQAGVVSSKDNTVVSDILHNFDKGRISVDTLKKDLAIFGFEMKTFGYEEEEPDFDDELREFFEDDESINS